MFLKDWQILFIEKKEEFMTKYSIKNKKNSKIHNTKKTLDDHISTSQK
jgi:hypothetical protein